MTYVNLFITNNMLYINKNCKIQNFPKISKIMDIFCHLLYFPLKFLKNNGGKIRIKPFY